MSALLYGNGPRISVEVYFDGLEGDATPSFTDISDFVREVNITRGRQRELEQVEPGSCVIVLDNRDRRFDALNADGPHYGKLKPMRPVRVRALIGGAVGTYGSEALYGEGTFGAIGGASDTYDVFYGYVDTWEQDWNATDATVTLNATDALKVLANRTMLGAYPTEVLADEPTLYWRLSDTSSSALDATGNECHGTYEGSPATADSLLTGDADGARLFDGTNDRIVLATRCTPSAFGFTFECVFKTTGTEQPLLYLRDFAGHLLRVKLDNTGAVFAQYLVDVSQHLTSVTTTTYNGGTAHHLAVVFTNDTTHPTIYVDGTARSTTNTGTGASSAHPGVPNRQGWIGYDKSQDVWFGGTLDEVAIYPAALDASQVWAHYSAQRTPWSGDDTGARLGRVLDAIAWPASLRDVDTGLTTLGNATALEGDVLTYLRTVATTEQGLLAISPDGKVRFDSRHASLNQATPNIIFGDADGEYGYEDVSLISGDELIRNSVSVTASGIAATITDAASVGEYYRRDFSLETLLVSEDEARSVAHYILSRYGQPIHRVTDLVLNPRGTDGMFDVVLSLDLGTRVIVRRRPVGGGDPIEQTASIEGITHSITSSNWQTTFALSPADTQAYLKVGETDFGVLGSNRVAY